MYVTLNISATCIRLLSIKERQVKKWAGMPLAPGLVRDGVILQPKDLGAIINALFRSMKVSKERVITSLTGLSFTHRILSLPRMKPAFVEEAIQRAASKEMPLPLKELYLSWQAIDSSNDELDYYVFGVPKNLIDTVEQTLVEAGVKPYLMDLKPLALARAANREEALIVALEPDCYDIVLVTNGVPAIMRTITPRREGVSIEDNIRQLTDELSKTVEFYNSSHPEKPLSPSIPLLLTGELSADSATSQLIQAQMEYPTEPLVPPLEFSPYLPVALYTTNMGLALKKVPQKTATRFSDINLNILSGKQRGKAQLIPRRYVLLPLALMLAIGLLFPTYQLKSQASAETTHFRTELGKVSQELHQARLAINDVEERANEIEHKINEIISAANNLKQEHQCILGKGGDFASNLKLVTGFLPAEAYFTSIEMDASQIIVEGEADSPFTTLNYAMALESQGGFSEVYIAEIDESTETTEAGSTRVSFITVATKKGRWQDAH